MQQQNGDHTKPQCRILIIGGGLAGLATAIALTLAGHEAIIFERMPELKEIGAGIQCPPNATILFKHWGILEEIQEHAVEPQERIMRSYRGTTVLTQRTGSLIKNAYGVPYLLVHRAALHKALVRKAQSLGVTVNLGCDIANADFDFSNPQIRLPNGDTFEGDLIVGADGERSITREKLLGYEDPLHSSGDLIFRVRVPGEALAQHGDLSGFSERGLTNYWMGPDSHAVSYMMKQDDWLNVVVTVPQDATEGVTYGVQKAEIGELIAKLGAWDAEFIKLLRLGEGCAKWTLLQSKENQKWIHSDRNFLLIGDSAHAMPPYLAQGAAQAFEDAAALGELFSHIELKSQIPTLLDVYQRLRLERSMTVKHRSQDMRDMFGMADGEAQRERDRKLSLGKQPGSPFALDDPVFQKWLWGHNAVLEARKGWESAVSDL